MYHVDIVFISYREYILYNIHIIYTKYNYSWIYIYIHTYISIYIYIFTQYIHHTYYIIFWVITVNCFRPLQGLGMLEALFGTGWTSKETSHGSLLFVKCLWKSSDCRRIAWRLICCSHVEVAFASHVKHLVREPECMEERACLRYKVRLQFFFTDCSTNMRANTAPFDNDIFRNFANRPMNLQSSTSVHTRVKGFKKALSSQYNSVALC